jgi:glutamate N-acetyltransferase/amino-acid N-acetyltransferase
MSVTAAKGFAASGAVAGIKASGAADLSLVVALNGAVPAAATFTTNKAAAAPVQVSRANIAASNGRVGAVILNSGCANAATGPDGLAAARATTGHVAKALRLADNEVLVCSTGLIGIPLPADKILAAVPGLVASLGESEADGLAAAEAILTTDTHAKQVVVTSGDVTVGGMVKGAGMIAPNMATMLAVLTTDAKVSSEDLARALRAAVEVSFNELTVDGCTSTNDTVIAMASGLSSELDHDELVRVLTLACQDLAMQLADDAEGTTRVCKVHVRGARSYEDARRAGRRVAESLLVKTSFFGADPYWGRVLSELGSSGADFDLEKVTIAYGESVVFANGGEVPHDREAAASYMSAKLFELHCDLGLGSEQATILTTDLGHGYIDENMRTS